MGCIQTKAAAPAESPKKLASLLRNQRSKGINSPEAQESLRDYFINYRTGVLFESTAYKKNPNGWLHLETGIIVWKHPLDLAEDPSRAELYYHYTSMLGWSNITAPQNKEVEVFASLVTEGEEANAWWGKGTYTVRKAPDEWVHAYGDGAKQKLLDNNFRNMMQRDLEQKGEAYVQEKYPPRVAFCIPILVDPEKAYDVSKRQTPEMEQHQKPPGTNLAGKLLDGRECVVVRMANESSPEDAKAIVSNLFANICTTLRERWASLQKRFGDNDLKTLDAKSDLAFYLCGTGAHAEAERLLRQALVGTRQKLDDMHPETLSSVHNLGMVLKAQGKLDEAEPLLTDALDGCRQEFGDMHPLTLKSVNDLGSLRQAQGKLDEAERLYKQALVGRMQKLDDMHPDTLQSVNNLAAVLNAQGKLDEAVELYRFARDGFRQELGDMHPSTLTSVNNLGEVLESQGKLDEAERLLTDALDGRTQKLGDMHPATLQSVNNLGMLLKARGKLDEAEPLLRDALDGFRQKLEDMHPETQTCVKNLGMLLQAQGKEALERGQKLGDMGLLLKAQGKLDESERLLMECV